jgi:hypothetical protein
MIKGPAKGARCPVCGGTNFFSVQLGSAETWHQQVDRHPQWKRARGLPETAGVAFSEPRLEWDQPVFDSSPMPTGHFRCSGCTSLVPPQFISDSKSRVLLITTGMPQAGKTTWLKCLLNPEKKRHLIAEPTNVIRRESYTFVEPYTIANPDPRTAVPFLLHGTQLTFQRSRIDIAGIDIKGEVFQRSATPNKYLRVLDILKHLRSMRFADLFVMFVVPFDATCSRQNIGQLTGQMMNEPGSRSSWQGVIWTHVDQAQLWSKEAVLAFLESSAAASDLARRVFTGSDDVFRGDFAEAALDIERLVQKKTNWTNHLELLESLTWLLYRLMLAYTALPGKFNIGNVEFYFSYMGGLGSVLVRHCMRIAAALFAAWDRAGCGDFAPMIRESMMPGTELKFPVLPCGLEMLRGAEDDDGLPVWGDLLLLEILRRHV